MIAIPTKDIKDSLWSRVVPLLQASGDLIHRASKSRSETVNAHLSILERCSNEISDMGREVLRKRKFNAEYILGFIERADRIWACLHWSQYDDDCATRH